MTYFSTSDLQFVLAISCVVGGYISYWITMNTLTKIDKNQALSPRRVFMSRVAGLIFMGIIPAILFVTLTPKNLSEFGILFEWNRNMINWCLFAGAPIILSAFLGAKNTKLIKGNVKTSHGTQPISTLWDELIGWAVYLLGYEFLFRGVLLFSSLQIMGTIEAIALNTALYSFAHLPKSNTETLGSLIFGVALCWATIQTGTIWTAFILHYLLASASIIFTYVLQRKSIIILS